MDEDSIYERTKRIARGIDEVFFSFGETVKYFSLHIGFMRECIKNGSLPYHQFKRKKTFFRLDELFNWIVKNHENGIMSSNVEPNKKVCLSSLHPMLLIRMVKGFCSVEGKDTYHPLLDSVAFNMVLADYAITLAKIGSEGSDCLLKLLLPQLAELPDKTS